MMSVHSKERYMSHGPSTLPWASPVLHADTRLRDEGPGPGWTGWLTVVAVLAGLASLLIFGIPN